MSRLTAAVGSLEKKECLKLAGVAAATLGTAYVSYKAYQRAAVACKAVKRWWLGPIRVAPAPQQSTMDAAVGSFKSESAMPGSEEVILTPAACSAAVGYEQDNRFYVVGCATRIDQWLVIPDHVRAAALAKQLVLRRIGDNKTVGYALDVATLETFQMIDTDLQAAPMSEAEFSRIGLKKMTVTPSLDEVHGAFVQICGPYGKGTTGNLSHHNVFGKTQYTGSTFEGYSGAPYMAGRLIAGVHLHGGAFNGGYSASYVLCMLKYHFKITDEDTAEWLETYVKDKRNVTWDNSYLDDEDVRVRVGGRYHVVKRDSMARVWGKDWARDVTWNRKGKYRHYEDYECINRDQAPSGEGPTRLSRGALSSSGQPAPSVEELVRSEDWRGLQSYAQRKMNQSLKTSTT